MKVTPLSIRFLFLNKNFLKEIKLEKYTGEETLSNIIEHPSINRVGLALAGFEGAIYKNRLHLLGYSEINYLKTLDEKFAKERLEKICLEGIPGIIISSNLEPPKYLIKICKSTKVALMKSALPSNLLISKFSNFLGRYMLERKSFHGTLMDIYGVGVLIIGPSGIGKSEASLELISKGHRLIGDDYVVLRKGLDGEIIGELGRSWAMGAMEIKSIGIINVNQIFGLSSWEREKEVKMIINLKDVEKEKENVFDFQIGKYGVFEDKELACFDIFVAKGRNLALIIEVAVKTFLLYQMGIDYQKSFVAFQENLCLRKE